MRSQQFRPTLHALNNIFHNAVSVRIIVLFFCPFCLRFIQRRWNGFFVALGLPDACYLWVFYSFLGDYARFWLKNEVFNAQLDEDLDLNAPF